MCTKESGKRLTLAQTQDSKQHPTAGSTSKKAKAKKPSRTTIVRQCCTRKPEQTTEEPHQCASHMRQCCIEYIELVQSEEANNITWGRLIGTNVNKVAVKTQMYVKREVE